MKETCEIRRDAMAAALLALSATGLADTVGRELGSEGCIAFLDSVTTGGSKIVGRFDDASGMEL